MFKGWETLLMKTARHLFGIRALIGLAAAGAALLSASGASAQTPSPYYAFTVSDLTGLTGSAPYDVSDSVNFNAMQITETFADGVTQSLPMPLAGAGDVMPSTLQMLAATPGGEYSDPVNGALISAVLTGTMAFPGISSDGTGTLSLTIQPTSDPNNTFQQLVYTPFSASLLGPAPSGVPIGAFSLLNLGSSLGTTVTIDAAPVPAAVPEASTNISLGLLLGLGGVAVARRKRTAGAG